MGVATKNKNAFGVLACGAVLLAASAPARSQVADFPSRPVTLLVPFVAGGSSDVVMRLVSKRVSERLKQPIVIDNRPGGAGNVAALPSLTIRMLLNEISGVIGAKSLTGSNFRSE